MCRTAGGETRWALALLLALAGCGDSASDADGDGDGEVSGDADQQADGDDPSAGDGGDSGDGDSDGDGVGDGAAGDGDMGTGDGEGTGSPEATACANMQVELDAPSGDESVQWVVVGGTVNEATPPAGGAYYFNGYVNLTSYTASFSGSVSIATWEQYPDQVAAGSYRCTGQPAAQISVNGLGVANPSAPGADCELIFEEDVVDGGRLRGTFWAYFPETDWPIASPGGCVHGKFNVTDAAD